MKKHYSKPSVIIAKSTFILAIGAVFAVSTLNSTYVAADTFTDKINALKVVNEQKEQAQSILSSEASSLADAIAQLQAQINSSQARINQLNADIEQLRVQILEAEVELAKQKKLLGESIKAMYVSGEISTVEMLATSKDLSDFFDKQQYQESVRSKIKSTLDKVTQLKLDLATKKDIVEKSLAEQQSLQAQLSAQRAEKDRVLSLNQSEQSTLEAQIKSNSSQIAELRRQQIAENARLFGNRGAVNVPDTTGYPWANYREGSWSHGGSCFYGDDVDPWGMCYRQCVSYVAWKVWKSGYYMPHWGGIGNANQWDNNAMAAGFVVDNNPGNGDDGTVAVSNYGTWGHVMYVESVNGDGTINVSQYNAGLDGRYSIGTVSKSNVVFIHFPPRQ